MRERRRRTAASEAFHDVFKWLNYVRRTVRTMREADAGVSASALAEACRSGTASRAWDDDSYMTPEDADDAALFGFEAYVDGRDDDGDDDGFGDDGDVDGLTTDLERRLTMENEELRLRILEVMSNAGLVNEASARRRFHPSSPKARRRAMLGTRRAVVSLLHRRARRERRAVAPARLDDASRRRPRNDWRAKSTTDILILTRTLTFTAT